MPICLNILQTDHQQVVAAIFLFLPPGCGSVMHFPINLNQRQELIDKQPDLVMYDRHCTVNDSTLDDNTHTG